MAENEFTQQFDLFVPYINDLSLRDSRETMERPFFSLTKRKRIKPIDYESPDGSIFVNVLPHQDYGMATIWDADILIWAVSTLQTMKNNGVNDLPRTLTFHPYNLLKSIHRSTGGREYDRLRDALGRLNSTVIKTNIRSSGTKNHREFHWIESWSDIQSVDGQYSKGMSITLSDWVYEGLVADGGVLAINPEYFLIKGGRERWLYRVSRKHAGTNRTKPFKISLPVLYEKSGVEGNYRSFKHFIQKVTISNSIPDFEYAVEASNRRAEPNLIITKITNTKATEFRANNFSNQQNQLEDRTINKIREDFPGWDIYALQAQFDSWIGSNENKQPDNYQGAFYGFVKRYHAEHKHTL